MNIVFKMTLKHCLPQISENKLERNCFFFTIFSLLLSFSPVETKGTYTSFSTSVLPPMVWGWKCPIFYEHCVDFILTPLTIHHRTKGETQMWLKCKSISLPFVSESSMSFLIEWGDFSPCCMSICQVAAASLSDTVTVLEKVDWVTSSQTMTSFTLNFSVAAGCEQNYLKLRHLPWNLPPGTDSLFYLQVFVDMK